MSGPLVLRSSGVIVPSVFSSAETEPLLPSAATRTASSAASSEAAAIAPSNLLLQCLRVGHQCASGIHGRSVSCGLPPACVSMQCTWPR